MKGKGTCDEKDDEEERKYTMTGNTFYFLMRTRKSISRRAIPS